MYRDETKNLIKALDWSKFDEFSRKITQTMYNEETCSLSPTGVITATIKQSELLPTSFIYFVSLGFSNSYYNNIGLSNSRSFKIEIDSIINDENRVRYLAYPIGGVIDDVDTYNYKIWVETDMTFGRININGSSLMPTSVLSQLRTWWVLLPSKISILN